MNGNSVSGMIFTNWPAFSTSEMTIKSEVVFSSITDLLLVAEDREATKGGRLRLSTNLRSSSALASAASVARLAFSSAVSAARRAAFDLWEAHQEKSPNKNEAAVSPAETQVSMSQIYTRGRAV